jgi:addiction module HigA family antidote
MAEWIPAEAFPVGEFIEDALECQGWTAEDLARKLGGEPGVAGELISGKRDLTADLASALGDVFGTSAAYWLNLDSAYKRWKAAKGEALVQGPTG